MDTFMDKLAQKLTAQEMIRANTAADAEEMNKLKGQVREYQECLEQMQKLVEDGAAKLENAKVDGGEIDRLVQESILKIREMQQDTQEIAKLKESLEQLEEVLSGKLEDTDGKLSEKLEAASGKLDTVSGDLNAKLENAGENIHKECVKVYRNVQAVVVEENGKQTESVLSAVNSLRGKLGAILGVSIAALIAAAGSVIFQILVYFQVI